MVRNNPHWCVFKLSRAVGAANARLVRNSLAKASANSTASQSQGSLKTQALRHKASAPHYSMSGGGSGFVISLAASWTHCLTFQRGGKKQEGSTFLTLKTKAREKKGCKHTFSGINRNFCDRLAFSGKTSRSPSVGWG